jgi:hypothetical protein
MNGRGKIYSKAVHPAVSSSPAIAAEGRGRLRRPATRARHPFMFFIVFTTFTRDRRAADVTRLLSQPAC